MTNALVLPEPMESLVRAIEDTAPEDIVAAALDRLRSGIAAKDLVAASVLAVSRATDLPTDHHGGPVHPVCGTFGILGAAARLGGDWALMPVVHAAALANKHVHSPEMGPYIMPVLEPATANGGADAVAEAFTDALHRLQPNLAERLLLRLLEVAPPAAVLEAMLPVAIRRNPFDDHYFLYPVFAARALDCIGWQWAPVILRPVVRYLAGNARALAGPENANVSGDEIIRGVAAYRDFDGGARLFDEYGLDAVAVRGTGGAAQDEAVSALGEAIGATESFAGIAPALARALSDGLSLEGAGEALSIAAALLTLRSDYGNPFDVHLLTGASARRYLISLDGVSVRNKVCALLSWATGHEVRTSEPTLAWPARLQTADRPPRSAEDTLAALCEHIAARPGARLFAEAGYDVTRVVGGEGIREAQALAQTYVDGGHDPAALLRAMTEIVCRDDFTEMHAFKLQTVAAEEHGRAREPHRWAYLVAAAKEAAVSHGLSQTVYTEAKRHLAI